jgi:HlyD family secretion protein
MSTKRRTKTRKRVILSLLTIAVIVIGTALLMRPKRTQYESVDASIRDITTYYSFSGNVETKSRQTILSEKVMQISEIEVKEGDLVEEDDVLMRTTTGDTIKAKINGEIVNLNVEENAQIMAGITLLEIVDYNDLEITIKVDEYDLSAIKVGKKASVTIGAIEKEVKGKISSMSKEGQVLNGVTFFRATVDLEPDKRIRVGMSAEAKLINTQATDVVTLPMKVIQFDSSNNPFVYQKAKDGSIKEIPITTGINDSTFVEIKNGISNGDTILYPSAVAATDTMRFGGPQGDFGGSDE